MKLLILTWLALALGSVSAFADSKNVWTVYDIEHPVYNAMKVEAVNDVKSIGGVTCKRISGVRLSTTCKFPNKIKPVGALAFYKSLKVKPIDLSGAYSELKIIGRMVVVANTDTNQQNNDSRIYIDHACRNVSNDKEAAACMEFWAINVMTSYEETNTAATVKVDDTVRTTLAESLRLQGYSQKKIASALKSVAKDAYVGIMEEHGDEHHLYYFSIKAGVNAYPKEMSDMNEADVAYSPLGEEAKSIEKSAVNEYVESVLATLLLGQDRETFGHFAEGVADAISNIIDQAK